MKSRAAENRTSGNFLVSFFLDTDTCSAHLNQSASVTSMFLQYTGRAAWSFAVAALSPVVKSASP
jgi:hypothetical protein